MWVTLHFNAATFTPLFDSTRLRPLLCRRSAGEDFAFLAQAAPSAFVFLGIRNATAGSVHNLHSPNFTMDESVLPVGAALHAALATEFLVKHSGGRHQEL